MVEHDLKELSNENPYFESCSYDNSKSDVEGQANAILQIISDSHFRNELITKGKTRATLFSWERTARETLHVYESIRGMEASGNGLDRGRLNP